MSRCEMGPVAWTKMDELSIIRSVVSQEQPNLELCLDYLAQRRQMSSSEYRKYFDDHVNDYVLELLKNHRLPQEAAQILQNLGRDVSVFFYQFVKHCEDGHLCDLILKYLEVEHSQVYPQMMQNLQFHWEVMEQLASADLDLANFQETGKLPVEEGNLEAFMAMDVKSKELLIIELYLARGDDRLLAHIDKRTLWEHLVRFRRLPELTRWCWQFLFPKDLQSAESKALNCRENPTHSYQMWPIDPTMYEFGVAHLAEVQNDVVRNCFAAAGHFFPEESTAHQLQRLCKTNSLLQNMNHLYRMPLGDHIWSWKMYHLMLKNFVGLPELEEMKRRLPEQRSELELVTALKRCNLNSLEGFREIMNEANRYLIQEGAEKSLLVVFFDLLANEKYASKNLSVMNVLTIILLLKFSPQREFDIGQLLDNMDADVPNIPTPYQLFKRFKGFDMDGYHRLQQEQTTDDGEEARGPSSSRYHHQIKDLYYLKQYRSTFNVYHVIGELLRHYTQISRRQLEAVCEGVYRYMHQLINAISATRPLDTALFIHCITFCEMLGFDTHHIRSLATLKLYLTPNTETNAGCISLLQQAERKLVNSLSPEGSSSSSTGAFPLNVYSAVMTINRCLWEAGHISGVDSSAKQGAATLMLQHFARRNAYWQFLVLIQYFRVPVEEVKRLIEDFRSPALRDHLRRALVAGWLNRTTIGNEEKSSSFGRCGGGRRKASKLMRVLEKNSMASLVESTSSMGSSSSTEHPNIRISSNGLSFKEKFLIYERNGCMGLFALILESSALEGDDHKTPTYTLEEFTDVRIFVEAITIAEGPSLAKNNITLNYLRNAIHYKCPILAILATVNFADKEKEKEDIDLTIQYCWLTWLLATTHHWYAAQIISNNCNPSEFVWTLIADLIKHNHIQNVLRSFRIFFPNNEFIHLFRFMELTAHHLEFGAVSLNEMQLYCAALLENKLRMPLMEEATIYEQDLFISRSVSLLLAHLQYNFSGMLDQHKCLACLGKTDWKDITDEVDFSLLEDLHEILLENIGCHHRLDEDNRCLQINFSRVLESNGEHEFERLLNAALELDEFLMAIEMATVLQRPIEGLVQQKWLKCFAKMFSSLPDMTIKSFQCIFKMIDECELEMVTHTLQPSQLVNFLLYIKSQILPEHNVLHYMLLHRILETLRQHHLLGTEFFSRDQIEYDMICCYLSIHSHEERDHLPLYYSEHFEECSKAEPKQQQQVLDKSFKELLHLATPQSFPLRQNFTMNVFQGSVFFRLTHRMLDEGDIVGALHLQELFNMRSLELQLLMFALQLAEDLTSLQSTSPEIRATVQEMRLVTANGLQRTALLHSGQLSQCDTTLEEFEEIPSKRQQETLDILKALANNLGHGVNIANRIVCVYRAAMYLDMPFLDILRVKGKDVPLLLRHLEQGKCLKPFMVFSDIITGNFISEQRAAELLALEMTRAIVKARFCILQAVTSHSSSTVWGYPLDRDMHLFLEVLTNCSKLGFELLRYCDALLSYRRQLSDKKYVNEDAHFLQIVDLFCIHANPHFVDSKEEFCQPTTIISHKKQNGILVELLIKAHECFVHDCCMEGIADVLNRAKLLNSTLSQAKSWSLLIRLLTGIGRYREMSYCFHSLIVNDQFESLLGQFEGKNKVALQQGILEYLKEHCNPDQAKELFKLAAIHFQMYKDLAEIWQREANELLEKVVSTTINNNHTHPKMSNGDGTDESHVPKLFVNGELKGHLEQALNNFVHATENYLLDRKILFAEQMAAKAELVAMQLDLASSNGGAVNVSTSGSGNNEYVCLRVICLRELDRNSTIQRLANYHLNVAQASILARVYNYAINWSETLLHQFIVKGSRSYFYQFLQLIDINDDMLENLVKSYQDTLTSKGSRYHRSRQSPDTQTKLLAMEERLAELLEMIKSVALKYKLASNLNHRPTISKLLEEHTIHYLKDINFNCPTNSHLAI